MNVEEEIDRLKEEIKRLAKPQPDGSYKVISSHSLRSRFSFESEKEKLIYNSFFVSSFRSMLILMYLMMLLYLFSLIASVFQV